MTLGGGLFDVIVALVGGGLLDVIVVLAGGGLFDVIVVLARTNRLADPAPLVLAPTKALDQIAPGALAGTGPARA
jgi:hypothetical protein